MSSSTWRVLRGYATYQRTPVRIISGGKWAPLKSIMVSPPCPRPESSQREIIRQSRPKENLRQNLQLAYRHGLRVAELIALRWDQVNLQDGLLHVRRRKNGLSSTHPLYGVELRALRQVAREYPDTPYVFVTERKGPFTDSTFRKIVARAGAAAQLGFPVHPHMLRHATGFKLANDGHDTRAIQHYLGHKNIQYTVR